MYVLVKMLYFMLRAVVRPGMDRAEEADLFLQWWLWQLCRE